MRETNLTTITPYSGQALAARIAEFGSAFVETIEPVLASLPAGSEGPVALAKSLKLDKVLTSRLLKAIRKCRDPLATVHYIPGPTPLARFLNAAKRAGADKAQIKAASANLAKFQTFLSTHVGDRGALEALISTWLPEARKDFELNRKQAAYRAMSQLRGVSVQQRLSSVFLAPGSTPGQLDLVWLIGYFGLRRLRPGGKVNLGTRRVVKPGSDLGVRRPLTLAGNEGEYPSSYRLDEFCQAAAAPVESEMLGEFANYTLSGDSIGLLAEVDFIIAEVNRNELMSTAVIGSGRKAHFSADLGTPTKHLILDIYLHKDVYPSSYPELRFYDRTQGADGDINAAHNEAYRIEMAESIIDLGSDPANFRTDAIANAGKLTDKVFRSLDWDPRDFRGYRASIEYPVLGTQVAMVFTPPDRPEE